MTRLEVILITAGVLLFSNSIGLFYSYLVLKTNLFSKYRIQTKNYKPGIFLERFGLYIFNLSLLILLSCFGVWMVYDFVETSFSNIWIILLQVFIVFLIDDVWFYFVHRLMHENKFLLKNIHSIHHRASTPFPMEYLYAHPFEWMTGMIGSAIGFGVVFIFMPINVYAFWIFGIIRNLHEIHIHSDLELPILSKMPFISKTRHHDDHQSKLTGNYASTFLWMDKIFKTEFKNK
jgi:4-alpha-methyl-delta7-sterol-4alpha-methyl oxidase